MSAYVGWLREEYREAEVGAAKALMRVLDLGLGVMFDTGRVGEVVVRGANGILLLHQSQVGGIGRR